MFKRAATGTVHAGSVGSRKAQCACRTKQNAGPETTLYKKMMRKAARGNTACKRETRSVAVVQHIPRHAARYVHAVG